MSRSGRARATRKERSKSVHRPVTIPFYASRHDQESLAGRLSLHHATLVLEFEACNGSHCSLPPIHIPQADVRKSVEFTGDTSFHIDLPDHEIGEKMHIHLRSDGEGRYAAYAIREWTKNGVIEPCAVRKQEYLARFDSTMAKLTALWQLLLPGVLFGIAFVLAQASGLDSAPEEVKCMIAGWRGMALLPVVAVTHFAVLSIPAVTIIFYSRILGLRNMFLGGLVLVMLVTVYGFFPAEWQLLPEPESPGPLLLPAYWLIFVPYIILLFVPSLYYLVVEPRL